MSRNPKTKYMVSFAVFGVGVVVCSGVVKVEGVGTVVVVVVA